MRFAYLVALAFACAALVSACARPASGLAEGATLPSRPVAPRAAPRAPRAVVRTAEPGLAGYWRGALIRGNALQEISIAISEENAAPRLLVEVPDWNVVALPKESRYRDRRLVFEIGGGEIRLDVDVEAGVMRGEMGPLGKPALRDDQGKLLVVVELVRRPDPGHPPIVRRDVELTSADGTAIAATLALPAGPGPFPGLVIVQGRSYGPRSGFLGHASRAARRGIAAIVFDGRGTGGSGGVRGQHTLQNRLDDARAALAALRGVPEVDADRVGLFGHSAGGWVVPVVAQQDGQVAFVVMSAGPAVDLAVQQAQVVRELLKRSGRDFSQADLQEAYEYQETLARLGMAGAPWSEIEAHVASAKDKAWADIADAPASYDDNGSVGYYRRVPHNSDRALASLTVPVLALYGADDWVVPAPYNVPVLEAALRTAGNTDFEVVVFPRADHGLEVPGSSGEDGQPFAWDHHPPGLFDTLFGFILRVTTR